MLRRTLALSLVLLLVVALSGPAGANGVTETSDTLSIVKEGETPTNVEVAVTLSQETPLTPTRVLIGRDDVFADSMAAGVLQGESPLLLVPPAGPVPDIVLDELARMGPQRVTLLGGEAAVSPAVEQQLTGAGYTTERRAGGSRFETAIAIAEDAQATDTVILARAFSASEADPTQAFADSLAAGGMAAESGWPVLLTQSEQLTAPTRDWMADNGVQTALIMGGTAAISQAVEDEVTAMGITTERLAGADRFSTGIQVAGKLGADSAADVGRVTLVDAQGDDAWAGGFAAAAHSAHFDAPIVLAAGGTVPPATEQWLAGGGFAQADGDGVRLTCVSVPEACQEARVDLELPPVVPVTFTPPTGSTVAPGSTVTIDTSGQPAQVSGGSCAAGQTGPLPADGTVTLTVDPQEPTCDLIVTLALDGTTVQSETATYTFGEAGGPMLLSAGPDGQAVGGEQVALSDDGQAVAFLSDGDPTGVGATGVHVYAREAGGELELVDSRADGSPAGGTLIASAETRPQVIGAGRYSVVFASPDPQLDTSGAEGDPTGTNVYIRDLSSGDIRLVSYDGAGQPVRDAVFGRASSDGRTHTYTGTGASGAGGSTNRHIFVHRQSNGSTDVVRDAEGQPFANADPGAVVISGDGSTLVFSSARNDLVADDTNARPDIFAVDIPQSGIARVNVTSDGQQAQGGGQSTAATLGVTDDGTLVVFASSATNLGGSTDGEQVYVHNRGSGQTAVVDFGPGAQSAPSISGDGTWIALVSTTPPDGSPENGCGVYGLNPLEGSAFRADVPTPNNVCRVPHTAVAATGAVAFSHPDPLASADQNPLPDAYLFTP